MRLWVWTYNVLCAMKFSLRQIGELRAVIVDLGTILEIAQGSQRILLKQRVKVIAKRDVVRHADVLSPSYSYLKNQPMNRKCRIYGYG